jgi:predicted ArsR family transcriptional regulator
VPLDRLAAAGDPQLRRVLVFARGRREPFTSAEAATELGVHPNVARARLDRLVRAGLLEVEREQRGARRGPGAGRPTKVYRVAPELEAIEFPDRRVGELISLLVEKLPTRGRQRALREAGEDFGRKLAEAAGLRPARSFAAGLERVVDALGLLGFQASVVSLEGDRAELASPTCPLRPLVTQYPEASGIDRGMWAGLVERGVRGVSADRVDCETPCCLDEDAACRILLSLGRQATTSSAAAG